MKLPLPKSAFVALVFVALSQNANAVYRCVVSGQTVFQDSPCLGSLGTNAEEINRRSKQQQSENERILQNSLAETSMRPAERSQRAATAEVQARAAVVDRLLDPKSAELRKVTTYAGVGSHKVYAKSFTGPPVIDVVCGEVNSKNRMGGYVGFKPFYWTSNDGKVVMSDSNALEEIVNSMVIRTCAGLAK
jgi:hypothetical protein